MGWGSTRSDIATAAMSIIKKEGWIGGGNGGGIGGMIGLIKFQRVCVCWSGLFRLSCLGRWSCVGNGCQSNRHLLPKPRMLVIKRGCDE